ncbi:LacI family transcriptional regulator [Pseudarthrobacter siccitolerans]|uniref:LacI family transcriptional regulator n=2 Tax=Pseudarthrobacter siccitolerans TaxID=861266 RepID=A0ABU0PM87_9MICC|nr:LacI family transcriptional regulator [Pseudarthrobacter siccitolerans]
MSPEQESASTTAAKPAATIYDIARTTGFSPSTVSRALHKPGRVGPTTEKAVRAAAESLGYQINPMARFVTTGRTGTVALVLSDITNPVFFDLVRGAERTTALEGQTLVVAETQGSSVIEQETVDRLLPTVDGIILASSRLDKDQIRNLSEQKNIVLVNRNVDGVPCVLPQLQPGIREAVNHLAGLGHTSLAFLPGPTAIWMSRQRLKLLQEEVARVGMSLVATSPAEPTMEGGRKALAEVLDTGATGVIAYTDLMAIGLLLACKDEKIPVPGKLSIIGFDDVFGSRFTSPPLTTIRTPLALMGEEAVRRLTAENSEEITLPSGMLQTEFVLRKSSGPSPQAAQS